MTSIEVPSPPLNESLDYEQPLERGIAATARRLPDLQFSNQVADSDLTAEEDQQ